jgi:hypothetical protein
MTEAMKNRVASAGRKAAAVIGASVGLASSAFAQAAGTGTGTGTATTGINDGPILTAINGVTPVIVDIGGAVLAVVVVAWGYKTVKGFLGR